MKSSVSIATCKYWKGRRSRHKDIISAISTLPVGTTHASACEDDKERIAMRECLLIVTSPKQIIECFANLTRVQQDELSRLVMSDEPQITRMEVQNLRVLVSNKVRGCDYIDHPIVLHTRTLARCPFYWTIIVSMRIDARIIYWLIIKK